MTCIIGMIEGDKVYIGCDSMGSDGWTGRTIKEKKVFKVGEMLIGFMGSFRMGQILEHDLSLPDRPENITNMRYLVSHFVESVRTALKNGGFTTVENNVESGGFFLVGYRGGLYTVQKDMAVLDEADPFMCIGSGAEFATGAMSALLSRGVKAKEAVMSALEISGKFSVHVGGPYYVESI